MKNGVALVATASNEQAHISEWIFHHLRFGFDPIFIPDSGDGRTFGEMLQPEKDAKSHRGESLRILCDELRPPSK